MPKAPASQRRNYRVTKRAKFRGRVGLIALGGVASTLTQKKGPVKKRASKSSKSKKLKVTPFSAKELRNAYNAERVKELEEVGALMALS